MSTPVQNAFTVDVESWVHASTEDFDALPAAEKRDGVMRGLEVLLQLLDRRKARGTFFVLGCVAEAVPEVVTAIRAGGHEVGSHGFLHRRVDGLSTAEFETDLRRSREVLGPVEAYRAPMWSLYRARAWAFEALARQGFRYDSSLFPMRVVGHPGLPRRPYDIRTAAGVVTEIPPRSVRGIWTRYPMGGTWGLRTFFYADIARAIRSANREGHPFLVHLHPWELDPARPPLHQPFWTRLALTVSFTNLRERIDRLLGEFSFGPLTSTINGDGRPAFAPEDLP